MIYLGLDNSVKDARIVEYAAAHQIERVVILSPAKFRFACSAPNVEVIEWAEIIQYKFFYRLLQEINPQTLVVVNECLRTQNRYDLTYNCIRHFLNQTRHQLVFQYLPLIDSLADFMILFDFDTRSQWKREKFSSGLLQHAQIDIQSKPMGFQPIEIETTATVQAAYAKEKERLFANLGLKDPHTIPRNLYLMSGKTKAAHVNAATNGLFADAGWYIGRNSRLKLERLQTYKEEAYPNAPYTVLELSHNFIDFADFMALSGQTSFEVLTTDLNVDGWYLARYQGWKERVESAYASLQQ